MRTISLAALAVAVVLAVVAPAASAAPPAPTPAGPPDGTVVEALPSFAWTAVSGADRYEWQIAADPGFNSPVVGTNHDRFFTKNTRATMTKVVPNGDYWWRVRAVAADGAVSPWSSGQKLTKRWAASPTLQSPANGATITYPRDTFRLSWTPVSGAAKYLVRIATDPSLASLVFTGNGIETQATSFTLVGPLAPDKTYYWGITPIDAAGNRGSASPVWEFTWRWPSGTTPQLADIAADVEIYDFNFSWAPVAGAAGYELEINGSSDFAVGSRVCCPVNTITGLTTIGTSYAPTLVLPNNSRYYWRVRALDASRNAGVWNVGPEFTKSFNNVLPSIKNLRMVGDTPSENPGPTTSWYQTTTPIITWDPVPGAASYEVEVTPFQNGCQWTAPVTEHWKNHTAVTAWTPLGTGWNRVMPYQSPAQVANETPTLVAGRSYCVRVTALDRPSDPVSPQIRSAETYLPNESSPAFTWMGPPTGGTCSPSCSTGAMGSDDYLLPLRGATTPRMPYFRWKPLAGAQSYFVLVARDPDFTNVIDYAFTQTPAYAPRTATTSRTYPDEITAYYWAVLPAAERNGGGVVTAPRFSQASHVHKQSIPPALLAPTDGTVFSDAPTFHWAPAEAARRYRLQISSDAAFSANAIEEDVLTDSTAYTSSATYPADTTLYWRVRADAESGEAPQGIGLTWSRVGTFRKTLLAPTPSPTNPVRGDGVPTWDWSAVPGAVSYDFQLRFPDGTVRDFRNLPSSAATPTLLKGTGIWTWQVRANFPQVSSPLLTPGPWTASQSFTRTIREPSSPSEDAGAQRVVLRWDPKPGAFNYRVQISTRADFGLIVQTTTTENTTFAPLLTEMAYRAGGTFYWRVAAADDAVANVGDYTSPRTFNLPGAPAPKAASRLTAWVTKAGRRLRVRGNVMPAHRGKVAVTLLRKRGGAFRRVAAKSGALNVAGAYAVSFARPRGGTCQIRARFPGDSDHLASTARMTFQC